MAMEQTIYRELKATAVGSLAEVTAAADYILTVVTDDAERAAGPPAPTGAFPAESTPPSRI